MPERTESGILAELERQREARSRSALGQGLEDIGAALRTAPGERVALLQAGEAERMRTRPLSLDKVERHKDHLRDISLITSKLRPGARMLAESELNAAATRATEDDYAAVESDWTKLMATQTQRQAIAARPGEKVEDIGEVIRAEEAHQLKKAEESAGFMQDNKTRKPASLVESSVGTAKALVASRPQQFSTTRRILDHLGAAYRAGGEAQVYQEVRGMKALTAASGARDPYTDRLLDAFLEQEARGTTVDMRNWWNPATWGLRPPQPPRMPAL